MAMLAAAREGAIASQRHLGTFEQAMLSFYWFATEAHWSAILLFLLPAQALLIGGETFKGTTLGQVLLLGAFVSMVVAPLFGAMSDRVRTRFGRRRPWLIAGSVMNVVGLIALAYIPPVPASLFLFVLAFMWVELWNNLATAPYSALIPDVVAPDQRGSASGWLGLMTLLGNLGGAVVAGLALATLGIAGLYWILAGTILVGMLGTVLFTQEPAPPKDTPSFDWGEFFRGIYGPLVKSPDFRWVFVTRFFVTMGIYTVQEFLLFYFTDVVRVFNLFGLQIGEAALAQTAFFVLVLASASISTLAAGVLSDRYGRKLTVYVSGALQGLVALVFMFISSFDLVVVMGVLFGLGYGAYQSVDWALASDVLPSMDDYAKDMGVWHIALVFPQVIATPVAGVLLDQFQLVGKSNGMPSLGYTVIFGMAVVYFVLGTVFVHRIKGAR